jgi:nucleoside-diphosphate-sugar epimerase
MKIAVTGATGFLGRYVVARLLEGGHDLRCWFRPASDRTGFTTTGRLEWQPGQLGDAAAAEQFVAGCDAVVHAALDHLGGGFRGGEGELIGFMEANLVGTLRLIEAARAAGVSRFVFISTCAVHEKILADRPLDETHPLWPTSHYGAHKAAVEKFIHSYGFGMGYPICALRPTGIYGVGHPVSDSRWFDLVCRVVRGETVTCSRGGKEVHAADVAKAVELLLSAAPAQIAGEAFNCCDGYISEWEVAILAKELSGSRSRINGKQTAPKHQIITEKLGALGIRFGSRELLRQTIGQLVDAARAG